RRSERREVLAVSDQIAYRLLLLGLVLRGHTDRVVHGESDLTAPERQERLLGTRAVHGPDRLGNVYRVGVEGARRGLEFRLAPIECSNRHRGSADDVFGEDPHSAQCAASPPALWIWGPSGRCRPTSGWPSTWCNPPRAQRRSSVRRPTSPLLP